MKLVGLNRQLAIAMAAITLGVVLLLVVTSTIFYYFIFTNWQEHYQQSSLPTWEEGLWLLATTLTCLVLAVVVAGHLAKRILVPLNAVADGIRRVAQGDLAVRAVAGERAMGEAATLVDDFNQLADQLQRMTEERTFWSAAIAHELRTPVTILRGRLQGLADGVFEPDEALFRRLLTQAEGLGRLIEDLRAVSLADSGHLDLQWQDADLAREAAEAAEAFKEAFEAKGQRIALDPQLQHARCDPMRIRQALLALLDNARRYAVPGTITVRTRLTDGICSVCVEDEGPGIPPESAALVFRAFRRIATDRDGRDERGSGLGLSVVSVIAQAHGGQARCMPAATGGTCFELSWPVAPAPL